MKQKLQNISILLFEKSMVYFADLQVSTTKWSIKHKQNYL